MDAIRSYYGGLGLRLSTAHAAPEIGAVPARAHANVGLLAPRVVVAGAAADFCSALCAKTEAHKIRPRKTEVV